MDLHINTITLKDRWYKNAVLYGIDIGLFMDSDGDGVGDFQGLMRRLDYISDLGVTCIWLLPFYPSPGKDNGYDISDYYGVEPDHGTPGEFVQFVREAKERGIRVIIDLVLNHTSNEHPWFQAARKDPNSKYRDFYIWSEEKHPPLPGKGPMFPGQEDSVWTYDEEAKAYYFHRFYSFQPSLNHTNPEVHEELCRIVGFWLELGISGFRVDAASHMVEAKGAPSDVREASHEILKELRSFVTMRRGDAILMAEADEEPAEMASFFGQGDEMNALLNFLLDNYLFLALAREDSEPLTQVFDLLPEVPAEGQWFNFLRNLDELDLERLTKTQREDVFAAFGPQQEMQIYGRGLRRRLAPMLGGNLSRLKLAYSLLFSLPGSPVFVYGDEIGMGEDLSLRGRNSVRTPMQWSDSPNGGFSTAPSESLAAPAIANGPFSYRKINAEQQASDPDSLLNWIKTLIRARKHHPEIGWGKCSHLETDNSAVFAHAFEWQGHRLIAIHNLSGKRQTMALDLPDSEFSDLRVVIESGRSERSTKPKKLELEPYGCRWYRIPSKSIHPRTIPDGNGKARQKAKPREKAGQPG